MGNRWSIWRGGGQRKTCGRIKICSLLMDLTTRGEVIGLRLLLKLKSRTSSEGERKQPRKRTEMNVRKDTYIYIYISSIFSNFSLSDSLRTMHSYSEDGEETFEGSKGKRKIWTDFFFSFNFNQEFVHYSHVPLGKNANRHRDFWSPIDRPASISFFPKSCV